MTHISKDRSRDAFACGPIDDSDKRPSSLSKRCRLLAACFHLLGVPLRNVLGWIENEKQMSGLPIHVIRSGGRFGTGVEAEFLRIHPRSRIDCVRAKQILFAAFYEVLRRKIDRDGWFLRPAKYAFRQRLSERVLD